MKHLLIPETYTVANDTVLTPTQRPKIAENILQEEVPATDSASYTIHSTPILRSDVTQDSLQEEHTSNSPQPSTSKAVLQTLGLDRQSSSLLVDITNIRKTIPDISPIPDATAKRAQARRRRAEKSEILTDSPYKERLEEKENEKKRKEGNLQFKKTNDKRKIKKTKETAIEKQLQKFYCVVCCEDYDEDWIQCGACKGWAHEACADIPECSDAYVCDRCKIFNHV